MTPRFLVLAAAATLASAAPRIVLSQALPDKPAPVPARTDSVKADSTKDVDPVGTYTVYLTAQGNAMTTTTRIDKKEGGGYTGSINADGIPPLPVTSVKVAGNKVNITLTAPDGSEAWIELMVNGEDLTGSWGMAGDGSKVTGKKLP
jgi:hypothetical protein